MKCFLNMGHHLKQIMPYPPPSVCTMNGTVKFCIFNLIDWRIGKWTIALIKIERKKHIDILFY